MYLVFPVFISRLTSLSASIKVSVDSHYLLLGDNIDTIKKQSPLCCKMSNSYVEEKIVTKIVFFLFYCNPILCGILPTLPWILHTNERMIFSRT
jgi:hypothetical protein